MTSPFGGGCSGGRATRSSEAHPVMARSFCWAQFDVLQHTRHDAEAVPSCSSGRAGQPQQCGKRARNTEARRPLGDATRRQQVRASDRGELGLDSAVMDPARVKDGLDARADVHEVGIVGDGDVHGSDHTATDEFPYVELVQVEHAMQLRTRHPPNARNLEARRVWGGREGS